MRVVVVGGTGNVGTSVIRALSEDPSITSVLGLARRLPGWTAPRTEWASADIARDDLEGHFRDAAAVVHLAWLFQPTHDPALTWRVNVLGGIRVIEAAIAARVPAFVYASSVGAYSPGPGDGAVTEDWPTHGWPNAGYTREKAYLERVLDAVEARHTDMRIVRMRPAFIFQRAAATEQRRLFAGPLLPHVLVRPGLVPVVPDLPGLRFQALHARDAAAAYHQAVVRPVRGAFNLAAEPVVDAAALGRLLHARPIRLPTPAVRAAVAAAWRMHLVPASPDLLDAVLRLPLLDATRARTELDWQPRHTALDAVAEFLDGLRAGAGMDTPPLAQATGGRLRMREFRTGVGSRP
jgi:nucleoside-diphosphate-sugar epimerase